jgi:hypothetical protein
MESPEGRGRESVRASDGVNEDVWCRLREMIGAANRGDADAHFLAIRNWPREVPAAAQQRIGVYLRYLLYRKVKAILGRTPGGGDLHELALSSYPRFREMLHADEAQLEETLRKAFEFPPLRAPLQPGEFVVFGSVVLGVLMVNPKEELQGMRPGLAVWLRRNQEQFRGEGLLDDAAERP